jgi:hypothetical protein
MKKSILFLPVIYMLAVSCSKNNNSPEAKPPAKPPVISSVRFTTSASSQIDIDSFEYDSQSRLIKYDLFYFDTLSPDYSHPSTLTFHYNGNDSLPVTATDGGSGHMQYYFIWNDQGKLQQDSANTVIHKYSYTADRLFTAQSPVYIPEVDQDTMEFENGNMIRWYYWSFNTPTESDLTDYHFTYSTIANPLHDLQHLGVFLYRERGRTIDYISSQLPATTRVESFGLSYTWMTIGGKVVSGTETRPDSVPTYYGYYAFRYL